MQRPPVTHRASLLRRRLHWIDSASRPVYTVAGWDIAARDVQILARVVVPIAVLELRQEHLTQIVQCRTKRDIVRYSGPRLRAVSQHIADLGAVQSRHLSGPDQHVHSI